MTEYDYVDDELDGNDYQDTYQYETIIYHSIGRIATTTILLALITGFCLTLGMEYFTVDVNSKSKLLKTSISSYLPLGISLIVALYFLRYLFKSTERFLSE